MLYFSERPTWLRLVFSLRGSELLRIRFRLLAVFTLSLILTLLYERGTLISPLTPPILSLTGLALGIFLGFRNNTSYDRFWEGRKLWGSLVNTSRTWARELTSLDQPGASGLSSLAQRQVYRVIAFVHALRMTLRNQMQRAELAPFLSEQELDEVLSKLNVPDAILLLIQRECRSTCSSGVISDYQLVRLTELVSKLSDIQGGCERIRNTPIPHSYTILIHRIVALYVFALPFGLVYTLHYLTPIVVALVAYTFLGLDAVGDELEDPFGEDLNDLPLSTLSRMIEINLRQTLGERDVPEPIAAVDGHFI